MLFQASLRAVHKEICKKKAVTLTSQQPPLGVTLSLSYTHIGPPLGVKFEFSDEHPLHFYMGLHAGIAHNIGIYSYFEKDCRQKCTRQSRKALWVVLSSLFFKEI